MGYILGPERQRFSDPDISPNNKIMARH